MMADATDSRPPVTGNHLIRARLVNSRQEIRLVRVLGLPTQRNAAVSIVMTTVPLKDRPEYDALFYAWGNPRPTHIATVNGLLNLPIAQNLYTAVCALGKPGVLPRPLWIDAFCINQQDLTERSEQVAIMGKIYRGATNVRVWLGSPGPHTEVTMQKLIVEHGDSLRGMLSVW